MGKENFAGAQVTGPRIGSSRENLGFYRCGGRTAAGPYLTVNPASTGNVTPVMYRPERPQR